MLFAQNTSSESKAAAAAALLNDKFDQHTASLKDVPKRFENESVVVLFNANNFYIERGSTINFVERTKTRVYLKDKAAIEKYSTYYTSGYGDVGNSSEVTIIKANGTSRTLELSDGVQETNYASIPLYYKSSVSMNQTYYKFALPDLEPGDIIDFVQISKNPMGVSTGNIPFSRIYLATDFPVVKTFVTIEVPTKDSYLYLKSLNGAPELSQKNGENGMVTFSLEDSLREKIVNNWKLPREKYVPHIKFILTRYTGDDNNQVIPIRTIDNRIHKEFTNDDFIKSLKLLKAQYSLGEDAADIVMEKVIKKNPAAAKDVNKLMELSWYYVRNQVITNQKILYYGEYAIPAGSYDMYIANIFIEILKKFKQPYDVVLTTGNNSAGIKNIICPYEINWGLRWNGKYIMSPTYYRQFGELENVFQGSEALIVPNFSYKLKTFTFTNIVLPITTYKDNLLLEQYNISINEDFEKLTCKRNIEATNSFTGAFIQEYYMRDFNIDQMKYLNLYTAVDSATLYKGYSKTTKAEQVRRDAEEQAKHFKEIKDSHIELVKNEYPMMDTYQSWVFNGYGMTPNSPEFKLAEEFTLNDLVKKAGNGYMLRIGALLGTYDKLENDFRTRNYDGSVDLTSSKVATVTFQIPEGYKATIQQTSTQSFSSDFISMESTVTIEGNTVVLKVTRDFKKRTFTIEDYAYMVKYYDSMYELTQTQIVLKKK